MKSKLSGGARPRMGIERLEQKQMLAGDVLVSVVGGHLLVTGDAEANQIAVTSGEEPGSYLIRGLDGTTVHMAGDDGAPAEQASVEVTGVRRDVRIAMGDGDDVVRIHDARFRGNVAVTTGQGEDRVLVGLQAPADDAAEGDDAASGVFVRGSMTIRTGADNDEVRVAEATVGLLGIATDGGDDRVVLGAAPEAPPTDGEPPASAETVGDNADAEDAHMLRARGISVLLGDGDDSAALTDVGARAGIAIGGGEGANRMTLHDVDAGFSLLVSGGRGDAGDDVVLEDVTARVAAVRTGAGADHVRIADSAFMALGVSVGAGDDVVSIAGTRARWAMFLGGPGEDTLNDGDGNHFGRKFVRSFELPAPPMDNGETSGEGTARVVAVR
ncbi:MAG: hypothetical protein KDA44_23325 [Planctomycetales bacterium]|nr:hypothetical protein [Planctomycetales bacterium]